MGTTLTGTKPKDTYDSLIKVEDNGPISGTAKYLSDGLGNNLPIAVSTSNVGIGTSAPNKKLHVAGPVSVTSSTSVLSSSDTGIYASTGGNTSNYNGIFFQGVSSKDMYFGRKGEALIDDLVVSTAEASPVEIARFRRDGGITFNGDTAAANALDDYEEGTWTMGVSFGGASVGVTTTNNTGTYTKIGRQVTVNGVLSLSSKGSSTGDVKITGLPFTIANSNSNYAPVSLWLINISFANQFQAYGTKNATTIDLEEITEAGVVTDLSNADFANNSEVMVNFTYFV